MASSDIDPATEALIAQLMAEDLGEMYQSHSRPIGASYHDYEEPLTSYERQCLNAENDPDGQGEEGSGWGPEDSDGITGTVAPDESQSSTEPAEEGTWNSRYIDDDGQIQSHTEAEQTARGDVTDDDDDHSDSRPCSKTTSEEDADSPVCVASSPAYTVPTDSAVEVHNVSTQTSIPTQITPDPPLGPIHVPHDHIEPPDDPKHPEPSIPPIPPTPNERLPDSSAWEAESQWDDGLDYSSSKGKGKAVRAYDELKRGPWNRERRRWDPDICRDRPNRDYKGQDSSEREDSEEEDEIGEDRDDGKLPLIRVPWPSAEPDELLSRREDAHVVEIRVGDDETLESILHDISVRDERRRNGEGDVVGERGRQEALARRDAVAWW